MSVAVRHTPDWKQWEGETAGGEFPLERFLGSGEKSAVFRTRTTSGDAAIKLVPASGSQAEALIERWNRARMLDNPHFIKIVRTGTWAKAGLSLAYLVMEYADEKLATVLLERALTANETLEMLQPVAEALASLHACGFVHGHLNPSNIFAVQDTLKLSSDSVSVGGASEDMRALAEAIVQALTQREVTFSKSESETNLIASLPQPFQEIVRNCSGQNGRAQWSAAELASWLQLQRGSIAAIPTPSVRLSRSKSRTPKLTFYAVVFSLISVVVGTVGAFLRHRTAEPISAIPTSSVKPLEQVSIATSPTKLPKKQRTKTVKSPVPPQEPARRRAGDSQDQTTRQVLPDISDRARRTVHGKVMIVVRVEVDPSGEVTDASLQSDGSRYFGKLALEAARKWRFAAVNSATPQEWLLRFEITRTDTKTFAQKSVER